MKNTQVRSPSLPGSSKCPTLTMRDAGSCGSERELDMKGSIQRSEQLRVERKLHAENSLFRLSGLSFWRHERETNFLFPLTGYGDPRTATPHQLLPKHPRSKEEEKLTVLDNRRSFVSHPYTVACARRRVVVGSTFLSAPHQLPRELNSEVPCQLVPVQCALRLYESSNAPITSPNPVYEKSVQTKFDIAALVYPVSRASPVIY